MVPSPIPAITSSILALCLLVLFFASSSQSKFACTSLGSYWYLLVHSHGRDSRAHPPKSLWGMFSIWFSRPTRKPCSLSRYPLSFSVPLEAHQMHVIFFRRAICLFVVVVQYPCPLAHPSAIQDFQHFFLAVLDITPVKRCRPAFVLACLFLPLKQPPFFYHTPSRFSNILLFDTAGDAAPPAFFPHPIYTIFHPPQPFQEHGGETGMRTHARFSECCSRVCPPRQHGPRKFSRHAGKIFLFPTLTRWTATCVEMTVTP